MVHMMDTDVAKSIQLSQFEVKCSFLLKWFNKFNQVFFFSLKAILAVGPLIRGMPRTLKKQKLIFRCYKALRRTPPDLVLILVLDLCPVSYGLLLDLLKKLLTGFYGFIKASYGISRETKFTKFEPFHWDCLDELGYYATPQRNSDFLLHS